ncbi:MAG: thioesterase family protein [Puia sp.]|nr:thioesterase family protein [Puia sp.]
MPRIRIELPVHFSFTAAIPIRITDLNYGAHVGNDTVLSLIHEARVQFLAHFGYTELNLAGVSLIMGDVAIEFKKEIFYGDTVLASVTAADFSRVGFILYYKLEKEEKQETNQGGGKRVLLATAQTGMVCYNYELKKVVSVPEECKTIFSSRESPGMQG